MCKRLHIYIYTSGLLYVTVRSQGAAKLGHCSPGPFAFSFYFEEAGGGPRTRCAVQAASLGLDTVARQKADIAQSEPPGAALIKSCPMP